MKKNRLLWLGVFIAGGIGLMVWGIFFLAGKTKIFERTFHLHSPFNNVAGLRSGSAVRLSGIDIGVVEDIHLPEAPGAKVVVTMRLDVEAQELIKKDAETVIETEGLVGSKIISIIGGSLAQPHVADGDSITSRSPIDLTAILDSFDETARYMQLVTQSLDGITAQIRSGQGTIGKMVYDEQLYDKFLDMTTHSDSAFAALLNETERLGKVISLISSSTDSMINRIRAGEGTLGRLLYRDDLHTAALALISNTTDSLNKFMWQVREGDGIVGKLVGDDTLAAEVDSAITQLAQLNQELTEISRITRAGALSFAENMEALKHNWLFKGYFERRGFWNRAEFEENYEKRRKELLAREQELKALEQQVQIEFSQVKTMQKLLEKRMEEIEKLEKKQQKK